jgi:uncharacterized membrane protein
MPRICGIPSGQARAPQQRAQPKSTRTGAVDVLISSCPVDRRCRRTPCDDCPRRCKLAAHLGWLPIQNTPLAFLGATVTPYILTVLAIGELVTDQLPKTPSRKVPMQFGARLVTGAVSGAALGAAAGSMIGGAVAGLIGAVIGTLGGASARGALARAMGRDLPAALIEDVVAVGGAVLIVISLA